MTRAEALEWLFRMKWLLVDEGRSDLAGHVEDAELRMDLRGGLGFTVEQLREWSYFVLPRGKRGRIRLVLSDAYGARAMAMLVGILRSVV